MKKLMHVLCGLLLTVLPLAAQELENGTPQYTIELINGVPYVNIDVGAYVDLTPYLRHDGTVAYTATQNGGGFGIIDLGSLLPAGSNTVNLGSAIKPWHYAYLSDTGIFLGDYNMTKLLAQSWDTAYSWGNHAIVGYANTNNPITFLQVVNILSNATSGTQAVNYQTMTNWGLNQGFGNVFKGSNNTYVAGTTQYMDCIVASNITSDLNATSDTQVVNYRTMTNYVNNSVGLYTNTGSFVMSAAVTQLVNITGMIGNAWSFRKPMFWSTNIPFSSTANLSLHSASPVAGCTEMWRSSVAFASVYSATNYLQGTNVLLVADGTPFSTLLTPFQVVIMDSTSNECATITNVVGNLLYGTYPTRYSHARSNIVSHAVTLNIPGFLNDELNGNTLRTYIEFPSAQTVGVWYSLPYIKVK